EFWPWRSGIAELVEHGQLDLVLHIDDGLLPSHFQSERLYKEDWICAVARDSHFGDRLPLKQYLAASHIVVATYEGVQTIPDKQLAAVGAKRTSCIRVPYFGVALQCLPGTELVLTVTSGMQSVVEANEIIDAVSQDVMSNYNAPDNRCYVEIRGSDRNGSGQLVRGDNLYDGQTREQLAFVLSPCASGKPCGDLFSKDAPAHEKLATTDEESYSRHFNTSPERCNEARNPFPHEPQTHNEVGDS